MMHTICVGRRKTSVARAFLVAGSGKITVNGRPVDEYFPTPTLVDEVKQPFTVTETHGKFDAQVTVRGGGSTGQAGAVKLSIARALVVADEDLRLQLRRTGMLTRDSRMVERKKSGQPKARKRFQFSKR